MLAQVSVDCAVRSLFYGTPSLRDVLSGLIFPLSNPLTAPRVNWGTIKRDLKQVAALTDQNAIMTAVEKLPIRTYFDVDGISAETQAVFDSMRTAEIDLVTRSSEAQSSLYDSDDSELALVEDGVGSALESDDDQFLDVCQIRIEEVHKEGQEFPAARPAMRTRQATAEANNAAAAAAAAAPDRTSKGIFSTPSNIVSDPKHDQPNLVDVKLDKKLPAKIKHVLQTMKRLPMRKHPYGPGQVCDGVNEAMAVSSLQTGKDFEFPPRIRDLCSMLDDIRKNSLALIQEFMGALFTEDQVQELLQHTFQILANAVQQQVKVEVVDIRGRPCLYIKEGETYYSGFGDLLVVITYVTEGCSMQIASIAVEVKRDKLTWKQHLGQLTGQMLHLNARQTRGRPHVVGGKSRFSHYCYGLLTNSEASVISSYLGPGTARIEGVQQQHFFSEVTTTSVYQVFFTVLARSLELCHLTTDAGIWKVTPVKVNRRRPGSGGDEGQGGRGHRGGNRGGRGPHGRGPRGRGRGTTRGDQGKRQGGNGGDGKRATDQSSFTKNEAQTMQDSQQSRENLFIASAESTEGSGSGDEDDSDEDELVLCAVQPPDLMPVWDASRYQVWMASIQNLVE